ncbi:MAG: AAA family ATPase [Lactobacillales bacterium]|jgi:adenylate kinase family enzyme|nr:AAA family ATPase [Lactobacillales bacterium]
MVKIYVIGAPGSGKSTYARALSKKLDTPAFDLDDLKWENGDMSRFYSKKRDKSERIALLSTLLAQNKNWICEGVYFRDWITPVIEQADEIIILQPPLWERQYRVVRRAVRRALGLEPSKHKTNIAKTWALLKWAHIYDTEYLPQAMEKIHKAGKKYTILKKY